MNGQEKTLLPSSEQSKFYSGDCYMFQYTYAGEDKEEYLVGTWFGKHSVEVKNLLSNPYSTMCFTFYIFGSLDIFETAYTRYPFLSRKVIGSEGAIISNITYIKCIAIKN